VARLGLRVAVLTNGSLLWRDDVRVELVDADLVSVKVDAVEEATWRCLDRPVGTIRLDAVVEGIRRFAAEFRGDLVTETMLVAGVNDDEASVRRTAAFVSAIEPLRAYLAIPTRPPKDVGPRPDARGRPASGRRLPVVRAAHRPAPRGRARRLRPVDEPGPGPARHRGRPPDDRSGCTGLPHPLGWRLVDRATAPGPRTPGARKTRRADVPSAGPTGCATGSDEGRSVSQGQATPRRAIASSSRASRRPMDGPWSPPPGGPARTALQPPLHGYLGGP
jgi:hypothetical protein